MADHVVRRVHLDQRYEWDLDHCRSRGLRVRVLVYFVYEQQVDQLDWCGSLQQDGPITCNMVVSA